MKTITKNLKSCKICNSEKALYYISDYNQDTFLLTCFDCGTSFRVTFDINDYTQFIK